MQQNILNNSYMQNPPPIVQGANPNAVAINIFTPQAYATNPNCMQNPNGFYSMYGQNSNPNLPLYPANYNNLIGNQVQNQAPVNNNLNATNNTILKEKTDSPEENKDKKTEEKSITPLTDEYVQSLENYLNNNNPKVRLIGAKELMERFKEDDNRKDNASLIPLLNKTLKDTNSAVRFLALTTLQLGYCNGNDETVQILKQIQQTNPDKYGEDSLLASEILLKMAAPNPQEVEVEVKKWQ